MRPIIFDLDDTIVERNSSQLLPGIKEWWQTNQEFRVLGIITNQGGIGLRFWMEQNHFGTPDKYPTQESFKLRMSEVFCNLGNEVPCYAAFRYKSKKGIWSPVPLGREHDPAWSMGWRKPSPGMLIAAMQHAGVLPEETLYVGDQREDELTAAAAGCLYESAASFFKRSVGIGEHHAAQEKE